MLGAGVPVGERVDVSVGMGVSVNSGTVTVNAGGAAVKADKTIGLVVLHPVQAANNIAVIIKYTDKRLILIVDLIFQLHLPDCFQ
jgi:hypothetical protein